MIGIIRIIWVVRVHHWFGFARQAEEEPTRGKDIVCRVSNVIITLRRSISDFGIFVCWCSKKKTLNTVVPFKIRR